MPFQVKEELENLRDFSERLSQILQKFEQYLRPDPRILQLAKSNVAPAKPREGMVVLADGTDWNPGGGQGVYCFYNSTWNKLG